MILFLTKIIDKGLKYKLFMTKLITLSLRKLDPRHFPKNHKTANYKHFWQEWTAHSEPKSTFPVPAASIAAAAQTPP